MNIQQLYNDFATKYQQQTESIQYQDIINKRFQELGIWDEIKGKVIELGAGTGNVTKMIQQYTDVEQVCVDFSEKMLSILKEWIIQKNLTIQTICMDVKDISVLDEKFDMVISCGMIEYVDFRNLAKELRLILKPNGKLLLLISRRSLLNFFVVKLYWKGNIYSETEIREILETEHYKNIEICELSNKYFENWYYIVRCSL